MMRIIISKGEYKGYVIGKTYQTDQLFSSGSLVTLVKIYLPRWCRVKCDDNFELDTSLHRLHEINYKVSDEAIKEANKKLDKDLEELDRIKKNNFRYPHH